MKIDFTKHKLHLVITPLDMRLGFNRLYEIALVYLHIDVKKGRDLVVFVSKNRKIAKNIGHNHKGGYFAQSDPVKRSFYISDSLG